MNWLTLSQYCLAACLLAGCGSSQDTRGPLGSLTGTVTHEGTPLAEGLVYLQQNDGAGAGGGSIASDGTFQVTGGASGGIPVGTYTVWFAPPVIPDPAPDDPLTEETEKEMPNLPQKYRSQADSGLTVKIEEGENSKTFELVP
ncbi:MAG: hypothetical protein ABJZ55_14750 [Fuerstiella sp.]